VCVQQVVFKITLRGPDVLTEAFGVFPWPGMFSNSPRLITSAFPPDDGPLWSQCFNLEVSLVGILGSFILPIHIS